MATCSYNPCYRSYFNPVITDRGAHLVDFPENKRSHFPSKKLLFRVFGRVRSVPLEEWQLHWKFGFPQNSRGASELKPLSTKLKSSNPSILVGGLNPFERYARQIGSSPQLEVKLNNIWVWNHHLSHHFKRHRIASVGKPHYFSTMNSENMTSWWFQPLWKICSSIWESFPQV